MCTKPSRTNSSRFEMNHSERVFGPIFSFAV